MPYRPLSVALLLWAAAGCGETPPPAAPAPPAPEPTWPTAVPEAPAPAGYTWRTLRHHNVHARLLVPDGAHVTEFDIERTPERPAASFIRLEHRAVTAEIHFDPYAAWLTQGRTLTSAQRTPDNVSGHTELADGGVRVSGYARALRCEVELGGFDRGFLDEALTICASLRPAPPGAWGPPEAFPNGTAVPAGAWVEPSIAGNMGVSLLGPYAPTLYSGWFRLSHTNCPVDYALLGTANGGEAEVKVTRHDTAAGPAYARFARSVRDGVPFDTGARVVAPRAAGCCLAELFPFRTEPPADEIAYVVALCDTTDRG